MGQAHKGSVDLLSLSFPPNRSVPAKMNKQSLSVAFGGCSSMVESDYTLKKKMRLSSSSVSDTTSRKLMASKSQNQSNRSTVRFAPAGSHTGNRFLKDLRHHHASSLSEKVVTKLPRACPRFTMKNLCLRRVFSPSSISSDWDFLMKEQNQTKELNVESPCDTPNSNVTSQVSKDLVGGLVDTGDDLEVVECSQTTPTDSETFTSEPSLVKNEASSIGQEIDGVSGKKVGTKLSSKVIRNPEKIFKNPGSVSYRRLLPYLMEDADGTRDAELMAAKDRLPETWPVSQSANSFVKPTAQSLHGNIRPSKKMTSSNATKISLCSQRKLFKVPGSVNYRRMVSYLKENSEDNSGTPETSKHIDPQKNIEETAPATDNKGASNEATDSNTCSNNVEAPLADPENEHETQLLLAESSC